jgi:hypothetical protein
MLKIKSLSFLFIIYFTNLIVVNCYSQSTYGYGTVIGGQNNSKNLGSAQSFINDNEEGIRIVLIQSRGSGVGGLRNNNSGGGSGVRMLEVPKDTDYLELLLFYANLDPRLIRKDKFQILRLASTGQSPYLSKDTQRYWTTYNFEKQYEQGGPFDLVRPFDIIIIQQRGLFNREFFDPMTDITFLLTLPTFLFSIVTVYNTFIK